MILSKSAIGKKKIKPIKENIFTEIVKNLYTNKYSLHEECVNGNLEQLIKLINYGHNVNLKQKIKIDGVVHKSVTPLYLATLYSHPKCVIKLLEYGSLINYKCTLTYPETVMELAVQRKDYSLIKLFIFYGADINIDTFLDETILETIAHDFEMTNFILLNWDRVQTLMQLVNLDISFRLNKQYQMALENYKKIKHIMIQYSSDENNQIYLDHYLEQVKYCQEKIDQYENLINSQGQHYIIDCNFNEIHEQEHVETKDQIYSYDQNENEGEFYSLMMI